MSAKRIPGVLPVFIFVFLFFSGTLFAAIDMRPYYEPLIKTDNTWTYTATTGGESYDETFTVLPGTMELHGVSTGILEVKKTGTLNEYARYHYSETPDGFYYHALFTSSSSSGGGVFTLSYIFNPPIKRYNSASSTGDTVHSAGTVAYSFSNALSSLQGTLEYSSTSSITGFETVILPEGTFNSIKAETMITMTGLFGNDQVTLTNGLVQWLAPFIGIVKSSSTSSDDITKFSQLGDTNVIASAPVPDVKINGLDGPLVLPSETLLSLTIGAAAGSFSGISGDVWLIAEAGQLGTYSYKHPDAWVSGISPVGEFQIIDLPILEIAKRTLPEGNYTFKFGVDTNPDGVLNDPSWFDSTDLKIRPAGQTGAISREEAIQKVLSEVITSAPDHKIIARMLNEPLRPGETINNAFAEAGEGRSTTEEEWFVWIDDSPYAFFSHPVRYVFVNRSTGAIEVQNGDEVPFLNGQPIWADSADFGDRSYWIFDNLDSETALLSKVFNPERTGAAPKDFIFGPETETRSAADNNACCIGKPKHKIAVLLYNYDDGDLRGDIENNVVGMTEALRANGFTVPEFPSSLQNGTSATAIYLGDNGARGIAQLQEFVAQHAGKEHCCDEIFIYYTGHGQRKVLGGETRYYFGLRSNFKGPNGDRPKSEKRLYAEDLAEIISGLGSCYINVIIDSCYSGGFISALGDVNGVETVRTSASENEKAYGGAYDETEKLQDPYSRADGERGSEFTSGYARAMKNRADAGGASPTAHQLTDIGFTGALENDATAIAGVTHPDGRTRIVPCDCCEETSYIGEYDTEYVVFSDPAGHAPYIGLPGKMKSNITTLGITGSSENIQCAEASGYVRSANSIATTSIGITGPSPFVNVSGILTGNSFTATGIGTVAGNPGVSVKMTGSFDQNGFLSGTYEMGTDGKLPEGKSIIYYMSGSK